MSPQFEKSLVVMLQTGGLHNFNESKLPSCASGKCYIRITPHYSTAHRGGIKPIYKYSPILSRREKKSIGIESPETYHTHACIKANN